MAVSRDDVLAVARLARLRLPEAEVERLTRELNGILEHVDALAEVGIDGVEPFGGAAEATAAPRSEDAPPDTLARPVAEIAPEMRDGFFTLPRLAAMDAADEGGADDAG